MKALIFAAGKGTRLQPFTNFHPKALAQVNGIALLERNIKYLKTHGINDFVINIHHFGDQIIDFLDQNANFGANIDISDESDFLLETGGGLLFAREYLSSEENFLIMNADILTDLNISDFLDFHLKKQNFISLAVSDRTSSRKLLFDKEQYLKGWKNITTGEVKLANSNDGLRELAFSGIHCLHVSVFDKIKRTGAFSIMEEYLDMMKEEKIAGYEHHANLVDVGKPESIAIAEKLFL